MDWTYIGGCVMTGGIFAFIQFLITRHDNKKKERLVTVKDCEVTSKEYKEKLKHDREELKELKMIANKNIQAIKVLLEDDLVILEHLETKNATNKMAERRKAVRDHLINEKYDGFID